MFFIDSMVSLVASTVTRLLSPNDGSNVSILMKKLGGGRNEFVVFVDEETARPSKWLPGGKMITQVRFATFAWS